VLCLRNSFLKSIVEKRVTAIFALLKAKAIFRTPLKLFRKLVFFFVCSVVLWIEFTAEFDPDNAEIAMINILTEKLKIRMEA